MSNLFYKKRNITKTFLFGLVIISIFIVMFFSARLINNIKKNRKSKMNVAENLPKWNLDDLYLGFNNPKFLEDKTLTIEKTNNFVKKYQNKVKRLSPEEFFDAIVEYETTCELLNKGGAFAYLKYAENLNNPENVKFYKEFEVFYTNISTQLIFFELEINNLSNDHVSSLLAKHKNLKKYYSQFLHNLRVFKKHQLSLEMEQLITQKNLVSRNAWIDLYDKTIDGKIFNFRGQRLNQEQILGFLSSSDAKTRKEAGKVFGLGLKEDIEIITHITNALTKDHAINNDFRKFLTPIAARNLINYIDDADVEILSTTVQNNYKNISHRYYKLKAKMLKQKTLHYTDRNAPLPLVNKEKYSYEEAVKIVLDAYKDFSPEMAEIGELFFKNNWIDVPTREGKRGGAFAHPTVPSVHPYLLLNFQGNIRDVLTIAHELGHGIHQYLARGNGYFMSDTPLTLAETASIFGEELVFRSFLRTETDKNKKIAILANKIEDSINTIVRQIAFLEFETRVHDLRKTHELTSEELSLVWLEIQKKSLGDIFEYEEEYNYYWSYISHFIHSPFYVYSYAFGNCLVNTLFDNYTKNPEGFQEKYIELLKSGGNQDYITLLKKFDLDPKSKDFWQKGLNTLIELVNELEKLLEE